MEQGWEQDLLNWIAANPGWSGLLIFLIAFVESLLVIGFFLPGIFVLFGVGTLVGLGGLPVWPILVGGSIGAFCGDVLSFWIGHRYRRHLEDFWPFNRYPEMLQRGAEFFRKHGPKSVIAGRFIGPLRPIVPASAGMLGMSPTQFIAVSAPACILWTPAYLFPGMVFGASLEVVSQYAGRLALVLAAGVTILWLTLWALRSLYAVFAVQSARWLRHAIRWTRRHPRLGRIAGPILDPSQPEILSVTMLGLLLVLTLWGLAILLLLSPFGGEPRAIDQATLLFAQSLRNHIADPFMVGLSLVSRWVVLGPTAFATLLWLMGAQRMAAALHWLVAMAGALVLQALIGWALRSTPAMSAGNVQWFEPSAPMTMTTVVLGFFTVMVAKELNRRHRKWPYMAAAGLVTLILLARIYLGLDWLSGALVGAILGLAWTAIVGIAYRQRALKPFSGAIACTIFYATLAAATAWQVSDRLNEDLASLQLPLPSLELREQDWWAGDWVRLPIERSRLQSVRARGFNLQVAAPLDTVRDALSEAGWEQAEPAGRAWLLKALNPEPTERTLPLVGKDFLGHPEVLVMRQPVPGSAGAGQFVLRLWDSGTRLEPDGRTVYIGHLTGEQLERVVWFFSYWRATELTREEVRSLVFGVAGLEFGEPAGGPVLIRPTHPPEGAVRSPAAAEDAPAGH